MCLKSVKGVTNSVDIDPGQQFAQACLSQYFKGKDPQTLTATSVQRG